MAKTLIIPSKSISQLVLSFDFHLRFEKYIGGKYLGELVRLVLEDLYQKKLVLQNTPASSFPQPWSFDTSQISLIEKSVQQ